MYHYVIVRADLPHGVQVAQTIHAAGESVKEPVPSSTYAVALHAPNEASLIELEAHLALRGMPFVAIREPDAPYNGQLMAIGVQPMVRTKQLRKMFASFKLVQ